MSIDHDRTRKVGSSFIARPGKADQFATLGDEQVRSR